MDRKDFIKKVADTVILAVPVISVLGCSSSSDDEPELFNGKKNCLENGTRSSIGTNHGHTLLVSKSDVQSGSTKQYSIAGVAGHDHNVTVTAENFNQLKSNQQIRMNFSNTNDHIHSITVSCA